MPSISKYSLKFPTFSGWCLSSHNTKLPLTKFKLTPNANDRDVLVWLQNIIASIQTIAGVVKKEENLNHDLLIVVLYSFFRFNKPYLVVRTLLFDTVLRMQIREHFTKCDSVVTIRWSSVPLTGSAFGLKLSENKYSILTR